MSPPPFSLQISNVPAALRWEVSMYAYVCMYGKTGCTLDLGETRGCVVGTTARGSVVVWHLSTFWSAFVAGYGIASLSGLGAGGDEAQGDAILSSGGCLHVLAWFHSARNTICENVCCISCAASTRRCGSRIVGSTPRKLAPAGSRSISGRSRYVRYQDHHPARACGIWMDG